MVRFILDDGNFDCGEVRELGDISLAGEGRPVERAFLIVGVLS